MNLLLTIIGAVMFDSRFKFCKNKFTESTVTKTLPKSDAPVIRYEPADTILASVPLISTPEPDDEGPDDSNVIIEVYSLGFNVKIIGRRKHNNIFHFIIRIYYISKIFNLMNI